jgi:hypothetical protein
MVVVIFVFFFVIFIVFVPTVVVIFVQYDSVPSRRSRVLCRISNSGCGSAAPVSIHVLLVVVVRFLVIRFVLVGETFVFAVMMIHPICVSFCLLESALREKAQQASNSKVNKLVQNSEKQLACLASCRQFPAAE